MKTIPLTQGKHAIVDNEDYERLKSLRYYVAKYQSDGFWYAVRMVKCDACGYRHTRRMHHDIIGDPPQRWMVADHINGDTLDNRRTNLRWATQMQNTHNRVLNRPSKSGYKGVECLPDGKYRVRISIKHKRVNVGIFHDVLEAARAYDAMARDHFGEFASVNFPKPGERPAIAAGPEAELLMRAKSKQEEQALLEAMLNR